MQSRSFCVALMSDTDFGRGDGDPLGGPTVAETVIPPDIYAAKVEFKVSRPNWAAQTVVITFVDPQGEAEQHLLALWRIWFGEASARAQQLAGAPQDIPLT